MKDGLFDFCPVGMLLNRCGGSQPGGSEGRMCKTRPATKFVSESPGWFKNVDETSSANPRDFTDCRRRPVMFFTIANFYMHKCLSLSLARPSLFLFGGD